MKTRVRRFLRAAVPSSIAMRIGLGFVSVIALHVAVGLYGNVAMERAYDESRDAHARHESVVAALHVDHALLDLQRLVLAFKHSGDGSFAAAVREKALELDRTLQEIGRAHGGEAVAHQVETMRAHLDHYREGVERVAEDRLRRESLLEEEVRPLAERAVASIDQVVAAGMKDSSRAEVSIALDAASAFRAARTALYDYLLEPRGESFDDVQASVRAARKALAELRSTPLGRSSEAAVTEAEESVTAWGGAAVAVVNATRGYLHLVNVVLAGDAHEFLSVSRIRVEEAIDEDRRIDTIAWAQQRKTQHRLQIVSVLTVLVGLLASWWLTRWIARPIASISDTLSGLAQGRAQVIRGDDREDEVGDIARAARVFADRNWDARMLANARRAAREQGRVRAELERNLHELERKNEELDSFTYSASHDLRAPLRSIALLASWVEEDSGDRLSKESLEHLRKLKGRTSRLDGYLNGLLEYSRAGRVEDVAELVDVLDVLHEATDGLTDDPNVTIEILGDPVHVFAPRVAVLKVVQNLVSNAINHHHRPDPHLILSLSSRGDRAILRVNDDGPGIAPELHERVFKIFETLERRDDHESSGLGLAIVKKLCESNGAKVGLHSDGHSGSTFKVEWPIAPAEQPGDGASRAPLPVDASDSREFALLGARAGSDALEGDGL